MIKDKLLKFELDEEKFKEYIGVKSIKTIEVINDYPYDNNVIKAFRFKYDYMSYAGNSDKYDKYKINRTFLIYDK